MKKSQQAAGMNWKPGAIKSMLTYKSSDWLTACEEEKMSLKEFNIVRTIAPADIRAGAILFPGFSRCKIFTF